MDKRYRGGYDEALDVLQLPDSGYFVLGGSSSFTPSHLVLLRLNKNGDTLWTKKYGGAIGMETYNIHITDQNRLIFLGRAGGQFNSANTALLVCTDMEGDTIWTRLYGGGDQYMNSAEPVPDGGYILAGTTNDFNAAYLDGYIVRTDSLGDTLWTRMYGGTGNSNHDYIEKAIATGDKGFIAVGSTMNYDPPLAPVMKPWVMKIDFTGDIDWSRVYGIDNDNDMYWGQNIYDIKITPDKGYLLLGQTTFYDHSAGVDYWSQVFLLKIDSMGNRQWMKLYGGEEREFCRNFVPAPDGGYYLFGYSRSFSDNTAANFYVIKTDSLGNSGDCHEQDTMYFMDFTTNIVAKNTNTQMARGINYSPAGLSVSSGGEWLELCVDDSIPDDTVNVPLLVKEEISFHVYPNPANNHLTIEREKITSSESYKVWISDVTGKVLLRQEMPGTKEMLNVSGLAPGVYFIQLRNEQGMVGVKRLTKSH